MTISAGVCKLDTLPGPAFVLRRVGPRRLIAAGGGGTAKVGVPNFVESRLLIFNRDARASNTEKFSFATPVVSTMVPEDAVMCADLAPAPLPGRFLLAIGQDTRVQVFATTGSVSCDLRRFALLAQEIVSSQASVSALTHIRLSANNNKIFCTLAVGTDDGDLTFVQFGDGDEYPETTVLDTQLSQEKSGGIRRMHASEMGNWLAVVRNSGDVTVWDVRAEPAKIEKHAVLPAIAKEALATHVIFGPHLTVGKKTEKSKQMLELDHTTPLILYVAYRVGFGKRTRSRLVCWNVDKKSGKSRILKAKEIRDPISALTVSDCGAYVGVGTAEGRVIICDAQNLNICVEKRPHESFVTSVEFVRFGGEMVCELEVLRTTESQHTHDPQLVSTSPDLKLMAVQMHERKKGVGLLLIAPAILVGLLLAAAVTLLVLDASEQVVPLLETVKDF